MTSTDVTRPFVVAPGEGEATWFLGTLITVKATAGQTNGAFGLIEQVLPPGFAPPPHTHRVEDEAFYILEGEFIFTCDGRSFPASVGSFVYFPRDLPHTFSVTGAGQARLLQLTCPGGLERFFVEAGSPAPRRELPPPGPIDIGPVLALAGEYRFEVLPPPGH